jgi:hypothetical protein
MIDDKDTFSIQILDIPNKLSQILRRGVIGATKLSASYF